MARKPNYSLQRRQREQDRQNKAQERQKQRQEESAQRKASKPDEADGQEEPTEK